MRKVRGFYAIVDVGDASELEDLAARARRLLSGRPCWLQLRAKAATARAMARAAEAILPLCRDADVPFCVNDRLDVALSVGADAVHLGQDDLPLADARRIRDRVRAELAIGFSTHTRAQALAAAAGGADYLGFGPIFPTRSKLNPDPVVGLQALAEVCSLVRIPIVAIGGITLATVPAIAATGASAAALISALETTDPAATAPQIHAAFSHSDPSG